MCWSKEISMVSFIIAIFGCIYLYIRNSPNDRWVALFAATVAMIQLAEFFMWSDPTCSNFNKYASMFALLILALEPLMGMLGGIYLSNSPNKNILKYMLLAYLIFIAFVYFTSFYNKNVIWCGTSSCSPTAATLELIRKTNNNILPNGKSCNLSWFFVNTINHKLVIIWILFLLIPFLTMTPMYQGILILIFGIVTYGVSYVSQSNIGGSMWCWFAIGLIFLKLAIG